MHVPVTLTGDAAADTRAVLGRAARGARGVRLRRRRARLLVRGWRGCRAAALEVSLDTPPRVGTCGSGCSATGARSRRGRSLRQGPARVRFCEAGCAPGSYRLEGTVDGRPWIFTNPVAIE